MPNVANLIIVTLKNLEKKQRTKPPKCNCLDKTTFPVKGKCQYDCIVYKMEVYSSGPNNNNVSCKNKKVYKGSMQVPFKKDITIIEVVSHTKQRRRTNLSNYVWEI